jgi:hypothetical protein
MMSGHVLSMVIETSGATGFFVVLAGKGDEPGVAPDRVGAGDDVTVPPLADPPGVEGVQAARATVVAARAINVTHVRSLAARETDKEFNIQPV